MRIGGECCLDADADGFCDVYEPLAACDASAGPCVVHPFAFAGLYTEEDYGRAADAGATASRPEVSWDEVEPADGDTSFAELEAAYDALVAHGLPPMVSLRAKRGWGTHCAGRSLPCPPSFPRCPHTYASCPPEDLSSAWCCEYGYSRRYYGFVSAVLDHMFEVGRPIEWIIVENEVNTMVFWHGSGDEYAKTRATVYKAVKDFNAARGTAVKVVDNGVAGGMWSAVLIFDLYCAGSTEEALDFARRSYRRTAEEEITADTLAERIDCANPPRDYQIVKGLFRTEAALGSLPTFDAMSYHFYEPWDTQEEVIAYIRAEMAANGYERPLLHSEGGYVDRLRVYGEGAPDPLAEDVADDLIKNHVVAFAAGVSVWTWYPLVERPAADGVESEYRGLYAPEPEAEARPALAAYRLLTAKLDGFGEAAPLDLGDGVFAFRFTVGGAPVVVLWGGAETAADLTAVLPGEACATRRVLFDEVAEVVSSDAVVVSATPRFVEPLDACL